MYLTLCFSCGMNEVTLVIVTLGNIRPEDSVHWAYISECHSHPLGFFVEFANIQHQGLLSSVTSLSANQQSEFHKSHSSRKVDLDWSVVFRCTCARKREYVHALRAIPARGYPSVPLSFFYLSIIILMEFWNVWTKHNFYYIRYISVSIQLRYVYLIVRSVNANNMNLFILRSSGPPFWKKGFFSRHLDPAVQTGAVKTPGCEYWLVVGRIPVSEVQTLVTRVKG